MPKKLSGVDNVKRMLDEMELEDVAEVQEYAGELLEAAAADDDEDFEDAGDEE